MKKKYFVFYYLIILIFGLFLFRLTAFASEPINTDFSPKKELIALKEGDEVIVKGYSYDEQENVWYKIIYNDKEAYIESQFITVDDIIPHNTDTILQAESEIKGYIANLNYGTLNIVDGVGSLMNLISPEIYITNNEISESPVDTSLVNADEYQYAFTPAKVVDIFDGDILSVRVSPDESSNIVAFIKKGDEVSLIEENIPDNEGWCKIDIDGYIRFVESRYISTAIEDLETKTVSEAEEVIDLSVFQYVWNNLDFVFTEIEDSSDEYEPTLIQKFLNLAIEYAADDSHGYRNVAGDNTGFGATGSFDCGGFVSRILWDLEIVPTGILYEPNSGLQSILTKYGLEKIPYAYEALMPGDILYRYGHTEIYLGDGMMIGAHGSRGHWEAGDQNGNEVSIETMSGNWEFIFRLQEAN